MAAYGWFDCWPRIDHNEKLAKLCSITPEAKVICDDIKTQNFDIDTDEYDRFIKLHLEKYHKIYADTTSVFTFLHARNFGIDRDEFDRFMKLHLEKQFEIEVDVASMRAFMDVMLLHSISTPCILLACYWRHVVAHDRKKTRATTIWKK